MRAGDEMRSAKEMNEQIAGNTAAVTISAAIPKGRLTKKIHRHVQLSTMKPPSNGPSTVAAPNVAPKKPA